MTESCAVSVIVVNWNTREVTCDCLDSLLQESNGVDLEVILVDNASSDGSVEAIRDRFPQVHVIANTENRGFAAANNQGIAIARGRYVLLLNSDTIVLDGAVARMLAYADGHPEAGVVTCRVLNPDRSLQPTCFRFPSVLNLLLSASYLYKVFPASRFFGRERMTWWDRTDDRPVDVATGCVMLVRREALDEIGPMDEAFFMFGEETDWCWRFWQGGWPVLFTAAAEIIHLGGQSTQQVRPQMVLQLRSAILQFIHKQHGRPAYLVACLLVALWFAVRAPAWLVRGLRRPSAWVNALTYFKGAALALGGWRSLSRRV